MQAPRRRPELPAGLAVRGEPPLPGEAPHPEGEVLVIGRAWRSSSVAWLGLVTLLWIGFTVFHMHSLLTYGYTHSLIPDVTQLWPSAVHILIALGLVYWTLTYLLNRTTIRVESGSLTIRHGPLWWWGKRDVSVGSLAQLYLTKEVERTRSGSLVWWDIHALTEDREHMCLLDHMPAIEQAQYIEWCIEEHLGIVDEPEMNRL